MDFMESLPPGGTPPEPSENCAETPALAPALVEQGFATHAALRSRNEQLIRRIRWIAAAGFVTFFLVVWLLLRAVNPGMPSGRDPLQVVRAEISALDRGDLQTAYAQLSKHYRDAVPFNTYHMLVISHRRIFLTRKFSFSQQQRRGAQMLVVAELESETGAHYTAKFTLVNDAGRWWIDDLHWHASSREEFET